MKLFAAEYLRRLGDAALEMLGPDGMLTGSGWTERFLHAPSIRIAGGSNEIQRNIIGERVLGLPRDATQRPRRPVPRAGPAPCLAPAPATTDPATLTVAQAARRDRVLRAALKLGAAGGYEAVQMRDVAAEADVALGTIYRYFSSKDHLLAAALVTWTGDLEQQIVRRPPAGRSVADRVANVLQRATQRHGARAQAHRRPHGGHLVARPRAPPRARARCGRRWPGCSTGRSRPSSVRRCGTR